MLNVNQIASALHLIEGATRIFCMTHSNPDGDALGAQLGLVLVLTKTYPEKTIVALCKDSAPPPLAFLPHAAEIHHRFDPLTGDLLVVLDCGEPKMTDFHEVHPRLFSPDEAERDGIRTIKIDHHPNGVPFAQLNIVDAKAASSCEIVVDLADSANFPISPDAATCLLTGIYTDTGSLMHSNTSKRVYLACARLQRNGADHRAIIRNVFRRSKLSTLKLWGRVLERITLTEEGGAVSAVFSSDFESAGADFSELAGAIDYVNAIPGMRFSMILSQRNGKVKGSLRTLQDDVDVAAMAQKFSGGGHRKAAGFSIEGTLKQETRWKVMPAEAGGNSKSQE